MGKYTSLKTIVSYFLDSSGKSIKDFDKAWILAFRALTQLNQSVSGEVKSVRVPVSPNKTAPLPSDYTSWCKIGVLNNLGEVVSLKVNNGLSIYRDNNPNRLSQIFPDVSNGFYGITGFPIYFNYFNNGTYCNLYGASGGMITYGECRIDEKNNVIVLNPHFQYDAIIIEYISNPQQDDDYQIETCLQEAVIAFIEWKLKLGTEESFYARAREGRRSLENKRVTMQQINDVIRQSGGMFLKS